MDVFPIQKSYLKMFNRSNKELIQISESRKKTISCLKGQLKFEKTKRIKKDEEINELKKEIEYLKEINSLSKKNLTVSERENKLLNEMNSTYKEDPSVCKTHQDDWIDISDVGRNNLIVQIKNLKKENTRVKEDLSQCQTTLAKFDQLNREEKWKKNILAKICSLLAQGQSSDKIREILQSLKARVGNKGIYSPSQIFQLESRKRSTCMAYRSTMIRTDHWHKLYEGEIDTMIEFLNQNSYLIDNIPAGFQDLDAEDWEVIFANLDME